MPNSPEKRYTIAAITLHWVMAIAFLLMLASGLAFDRWEGMPKDLKFNLYQWHKSLGLLLLLAASLRIALRLYFKPPEEPKEISKLDQIGAKIGHWALYALMFIMPISGWVMVSSSSYGLPTIVFNLFEWPHIPNIQGDKEINGLARSTHEYIGYAFIVLIGVHISAVIKHYFMDGINLLPRMGIGKDKKS